MGIAAAICLLVVAFFFWLHVSVERAVRRELRGLAEAPCPACGELYGLPTSENARRAYLAACDAERRRRPDLRINFARRWEVACPRCGGAALYHFETGAVTAA